MGADAPHGDRGWPAASVVEAARSHAYDRYLSALLAPRDTRADLVVLAAFVGEVSRVPLSVREAAIGEIRLQWWRDALGESSVASGHPVADAMAEMAARRGLSRDDLVGLIDGFARELYEDGIRDGEELSLYADETQGSVLRLAIAILRPDGAGISADAITSAARALALTRLALSLPQHLAHGRLPLPPEFGGGVHDPRLLEAIAARDAARVLTEALAADALRALALFRSGEGHMQAEVAAAFLPLALVGPYLAAATKPGRDVLTDVADVSPLSRVVRLWFAHWRGKV